MLFINILKYISLFLIISIIGLYSFVEYRIFQFNKNSIDIIAHAGGQIDGHIYTNSLEALNNSYNEGAKIFELDIRETKDGYYVGKHGLNKRDILANYHPILKNLNDIKF